MTKRHLPNLLVVVALVASAAVAGALPGCWNPGVKVVKPEGVHGTWSGTLVPITVYGKEDEPIEAVALVLDGGTPLPSPRFAPLPPAGERAVLVDRSWRVADPDGLNAGRPVRVTGLMKEYWVKDRHGVKVALERGAPALKFHAIHPETIRAVASQ
jgi:hypothetical protein